MAPRRDKIQLEVEINGKKAGKTYKDLVADARNLNREMRNLVPGTEAFTRKAGELRKVNNQLADIRKETKGVSKGMNDMRVSATSALKGLVAFFAVDRIIDWSKALFNAGVQQDALARKAQTVLGPTLDQVTRSAERHAEAMGLTTDEYIAAAAAGADLLIPMGFQRQEAADISVELVNLSGALSEWTGGQRSAQEVSEILNKALLGEREQLKTLGISISEADVKQRLLDKGLQDLTGTMLQQARAAATLELITEKSADAQAAFATNTDSAIRRQAELSARMKEIAATLSRVLLPVFERLLNVAGRVTDFLAKVAEKFDRMIDPATALTEIYDEQTRAVGDLEEELIPLLSRYEELQAKTTPTKEEQEELRVVIQQIGEITPTAITQIDEYGNILGINAQKSREFLDAEKARLQFINQEAIGALDNQIERYRLLREELQRQIESGKVYEQGVNSLIEKTLSPEEITNRIERLRELTTLITGAREELNRLTGDNLELNAPGEEDVTGDPAEDNAPVGGDPLGGADYQKIFEQRLKDLEEGLERERLLIENALLLGDITQEQQRIQDADAERQFFRNKLRLLEEFKLQESNIYLETTNELLRLQQERSVQVLESLEILQPLEIQLHQQHGDEIKRIYSGVSDSIVTNLKKGERAKSEILRDNLRFYSEYADALVGFLESEEGKRDGIAKKAKQREIAAVTIASSTEIAQIWANSQQSLAAKAFGPAAGAALAVFQTALALGRTKQRISEIQAQQFADGGRILPHFSGRAVSGQNISEQSNGDNVLATLRVGEVVLNSDQQRRLGGPSALRHAGVPGFAEGGLVTVDTTPVVQDIDLARPGESSNNGGDVVREIRALRRDVSMWQRDLRAVVSLQELESRQSEISEIRGLADI